MYMLCAKVLDSGGNLFKYEVYNTKTDQIALIAPYEVDKLFKSGQLINVSDSINMGTKLEFFGLSKDTFPLYRNISSPMTNSMVLKIDTRNGVQFGIKLLLPHGYFKDVTISSAEKWLKANNFSLYNATIENGIVQPKVENTIAIHNIEV